MPYSNDRTIVSATDDVRIFDIEHSGHSALGAGTKSTSTGRRSMGMARDGVTLTEGDTNAKAFRSHADTVKRIVTEDNPFYFLTCSNDGDVRQWDIRQPAKSYPPAADTMLPPWARDAGPENLPPPLISYRRYGLDLNTVSCSPSQPHYIALGGAHLHCFLHDRRMLGRDQNHERGSRLPSPSAGSDVDTELLGKATQCVKKFAPNGKRRMKRNDGGHITACKISDAYPNELIVSWSQDHVYSFDMLRAPDASEKVARTKLSHGDTNSRVKEQNRKRKRTRSGNSSQETEPRSGSRQRTESTNEDLALRVTYGNGQSEDIRIEAPTDTSMTREELEDLRSSDHYRIAKTSVMMQKRMFDLGEHGETGLKLAFTSILGYANSILMDMDDIDRGWGYPVNPDAVDVAVQNKLRDSRAASRRFVQATGTLARVLGGQLLIGANSDALISQHFASIVPAPRERDLPRQEQFGYDFLKAIISWLDSGPGALIKSFSGRSSSLRLPVPQDSDMDAIDEYIIPYLLELAGDDPIVNVDVSRFETDDTRILFSTEKAAVEAFSVLVKTPFTDLAGVETNKTAEESTQDREAAKRRWAHLVGRGVLLNASKDINFTFIDRAYGGRGISDKKMTAVERTLRRQQEAIEPMVEEGSSADTPATPLASTITDNELTSSNMDTPSVSGSDHPRIATEDEDDSEGLDDDSNDYDETTDSGDVCSEEDNHNDDDDDGEEDGEGLTRTRSGRMLWRSDFGRSRFKREKVELDTPCAPHTRVYRGHCNVKTVKDVNYFGLQDEYVVSGSDSGHVFIWDRKTAQLVNILEGDGEVVNVVQGMCSICTVLTRLLTLHRPPVRAHYGCLRHRPYHQDLLPRCATAAGCAQRD